jgi:hypothetical protein
MPVYPYFFAWPVEERQIGGNTGVHLELVAEEEALPVMRELRLVKPKQDVFLRP